MAVRHRVAGPAAVAILALLSIGRAAEGGSLPDVFASVVSEVKARTQIRILLPEELPEPFTTARHALVDEATPTEYAISLYYKLGIGDAGFAASFSAQTRPSYDPAELPNVQVVMLARGMRGFFRAVSCGGSCAPADLWWQEGGILYSIQLELPSSTSKQTQQRTAVMMVDSAIRGGFR